MALHSIRNTQKIPITLEQAWQFYSDPACLSQITPPGMNFRIISQHHGPVLYAGQLIEYKVSPLLGIPLYWMTEIAYAQRPFYFVDEQRRGPYRFWQHQHHFRAIEGGIEMTDIVHYQNPFWLLGRLANRLLVRKKLRQIFEYRFYRIEEIFGKWPGGQQPDIQIR